MHWPNLKMLFCYKLWPFKWLVFFHFRDFDSRLYLCIEAFGFLTMDVFERLSKYLAFPMYVVTHGTLLVVLFIAVMQNWR